MTSSTLHTAGAAPAPFPADHHHVFLGAEHQRNERRVWLVIALTASMMVAEILAGKLYGSMALVADGWHMSTHAGAMLITALAYGYARRHAANPKRANKRQAVYAERLRNFGYLLVHLFIWLVFIELGLRVWGLSMISFAEGDGHDISLRLLGLAGTLIVAWLVWILADTAVHHALVRSRRGLANARAQTMMPLIRNVMFVVIFIILTVDAGLIRQIL